jgi:hypothetical protein
MKKYKNIIIYLSRKLEASSSEIADFLMINRRTLYNYKNFTDEVIPQKIKQRIIKFFVNNIDKRLDTIDIIENYLTNINEDIGEEIYQKMIYISNAREGLISDILEDRQENVLNVSKSFYDSLIELLKEKLNKGNDYSFLEYINNYKKD